LIDCVRRRAVLALAAFLAAAAPAHAARVAVVASDPFPLERYAEAGAVGLVVPGAGSTVTREGALAALVRGEVKNALVGGVPTGKPLLSLAREPAAITIYVGLPPAGSTHNVRRYPIAVVGAGYHGILRSSATRIPGLVSIADVAPTALALERGEPPRITAAAGGVADLRRLDARLAAAHDARAAVRVTVVALLFAFFVAALLARSRLLARAGLLAAPLALAAALALSGAHEARLAVVLPVLVAAGAVGLALARRGDRVAALVVLAVLVAELVVLAAAPQVNALSVLGPHPDGGGRYYGITNEVETLLLAPALFAATVLGPVVALPALALVGWSRAGADGGGLLVLAAAFVALWLRRVTPRRVLAAAAAIVLAGLLFVAVDRATGGSSHVTDAVLGGPSRWWDEAAHRWDVSWKGATKTWAIVLQSLSGLVALAVFAWRAYGPATVALAVGIAVSLVVNDTPQDVLAFGALTGASLWAWERFRSRRLIR
jgi:hypothetical protein